MEKTLRIRRGKLIIGVVALLFAGIIYAWSIINAPFRIIGIVDGAEAVLNYTQLGLNYTLTIIFFCLGGFCSGLVSKRTSTTLRFIVSALMLFTSFFVSSLLTVTLSYSENHILLFIAYGMLGGLGIGVAYNTVISTVNMWYPDKRGFCSGLLLTGFGLSLLVVGSITDVMGRSEAIGWRNTYVAIAIALAVIFLIAAIFLKPPPEGTVFPPSKSKAQAAQSGEIRNYSAAEMIKRPSFILIFIFCMIISSSASAAISFARDIMITIGATGNVAVIAVGILGVFNGVGRLLSGWLFDNHGIRKTQLLSSALAILAPVTIISALAGDFVILGIVGLSLCGMSFGFAPTTLSVLASEFYGPKNFAINFGILSMVLIPASFAATLAGSIRAATGGFTITFIILASLSLVGFIVNLGIKKP